MFLLSRLSALNICLGYDATATLMEKLGEDFDKKLLEWKEEVERGENLEQEMLEMLKKVEAADNTELIEECKLKLKTHRKTMHPGYSFTGDNVDINCRTRQMTVKNRNKDHHLFQLVAFKNRIPSNHLPSNVPSADVNKVPFSSFIPSPEEQTILKEEMIVLVGLKWAHYIPALSRLKDHLPPCVTHENMEKTRMKTEKVR